MKLETELLVQSGHNHKPTFVNTIVTISPQAKEELQLTTDARIIAYAQQFVDIHSHMIDVLFDPRDFKKNLLLQVLAAKEKAMAIPDKANTLDMTGGNFACCFTNEICIENDRGGWTCRRWCCDYCN